MFGVDDAALAILAAGLASSAGALYTNRQNLKYQAKVNDVNWQIAAMNNATQMEMANTAHQREVSDLRAAGLNPILSAGGSGASTPSLTSVRGDAAQIENPVNGIASSARGLARYFGETYQTNLDQAKADVDATRISNDLSRRQLDLQDMQVDNDLIEENLRKQALLDATGTTWRTFKGKDGKPYREIVFDDPGQFTKASRLQSDAFEARLRDGTNVNWRNNLKAVGGAVGDVSSVMNGAGALMRATRNLQRTRSR